MPVRRAIHPKVCVGFTRLDACTESYVLRVAYRDPVAERDEAMLYGYASDTDFEASESGEYRSRFNFALCLPRTLGLHLELLSRQQSITPQTPGSPPCQFQLSSLPFQLIFSFLTPSIRLFSLLE